EGDREPAEPRASGGPQRARGQDRPRPPRARRPRRAQRRGMAAQRGGPTVVGANRCVTSVTSVSVAGHDPPGPPPPRRRRRAVPGGAHGRRSMAGNRAVAYKGPGKVEVIDTDYPTFELKDGPGVNPANVGRKVPHGVILKTVATNICGSDQHMVRGRTTAPSDL